MVVVVAEGEPKETKSGKSGSDPDSDEEGRGRGGWKISFDVSYPLRRKQASTMDRFNARSTPGGVVKAGFLTKLGGAHDGKAGNWKVCGLEN